MTKNRCGLSTPQLAGAILGVAVVVGAALLIWMQRDIAAQHKAAEQERQRLREELGLDADMDPVQFLGNRLEAELGSNRRLSRKDVDELVVGYTERVERGTATYYCFFIVVSPLFGRSGGIICASFSEEGFLESVWWDTSDPLPSVAQ